MQNFNPLHPLWYLKYLCVFSLILIFFVARTLGNISLENIFYSLLFLTLIIWFYLAWKKFNLSFEDKTLTVSSFLKKPSIISLASIEKALTRQDIFGKIAGTSSLFLQISDKEATDNYSINAFGSQVKIGSVLEFPGVFDNLLCIPSISVQNTSKILKQINNLTGKNLVAENLGVSFPWYRNLSRVNYILFIVLLLFLLLLVIAMVVFHFILQF